jgi:hypothetical protein
MKSFNSIVIILLFTLFTKLAYSQQNNNKLITKAPFSSVSYTDSLINEFKSELYNCLDQSGIRSKIVNPTFTVLKIDIDKNGKLTDIKFSDSADTLFIKTYMGRHKYHDDKSTLEKYAKAKSYTNISILIPVNYEPAYNSKNSFNADKIGDYMKFNKKDFTGKAIMLTPIQIGVLSEHNM